MGATFIRPINEIVFDSAGLYYRFMTPQKLEILSLIIQKIPDSIFHLAQIANRDYASVLRDCKALEMLKFIKLQHTQDNRNTKRPVLFFDYNTIEVQFPTSTVVHKLDQTRAA